MLRQREEMRGYLAGLVKERNEAKQSKTITEMKLKSKETNENQTKRIEIRTLNKRTWK